MCAHPGLFVIAVALILSACGTPAAGGKGDRPPIRWGVFKNYQPVFIAKAKGFFAEEKVDVEFVGAFTSGPAIVQAAATNNLDAGHSSISGIVNAVSSNIEVVGIADSQTEFKDAALMQWFVLAESPIKCDADLRGTKIGVNSLSGSFLYSALEALKQHGLTKEDVEKDFVAKHPETVRRFLRAYNRAIEFIATHPEEASRVMAEQIGISADLVEAHRYTNNAEVRLRDVQFWIEMMR